MTTLPAPFRGNELQLELMDPKSVELVRLSQHEKGDWDPPPEEFRTLRVDPPDGYKHAYAVLYTGSTLAAAAIECRILCVDNNDNYSWSSTQAARYDVIRYAFERPALFLPLDGPNRAVLERGGLTPSFGDYSSSQAMALQLFQRFGAAVHGLSWASFHRNQPGRVYALWHHHKATVQLEIRNRPYNKLINEPEWNTFLAEHPKIKRIDP